MFMGMSRRIVATAAVALLTVAAWAGPSWAKVDKGDRAAEFSGIKDKREGIDVPDPIGMGLPAYEEVAKIFEAAIPAIIAYVESTGAA